MPNNDDLAWMILGVDDDVMMLKYVFFVKYSRMNLFQVFEIDERALNFELYLTT